MKCTVSCKLCSKEFNCKAYLKRHLKKVHRLIQHRPRDTTFHQCDICEKKLKTIFSLKRHFQSVHDISLQTVHGDQTDVLSFTCILCCKLFETITCMKQHLIRHQKDSYWCDLCGEKKGSYKLITRHMNIGHKSQLDRTCTLCKVKKTFKTKRCFKHHMESRHSSARVITFVITAEKVSKLKPS